MTWIIVPLQHFHFDPFGRQRRAPDPKQPLPQAALRQGNDPVASPQHLGTQELAQRGDALRCPIPNRRLGDPKEVVGTTTAAGPGGRRLLVTRATRLCNTLGLRILQLSGQLAPSQTPAHRCHDVDYSPAPALPF